MRKLSVKKLLLIVGVLGLILAAFIAGGIKMASVQAASTNTLNKSATLSKGDTRDTKCKKQQCGSTNQAKGLVTINDVSGNKIQATFLEPSDKKGSTITIITTSSTSYKPNSSIVVVGKAIFFNGTVNTDGSVTAQVLAFYDPTAADFSGVVSKIDGSTLTLQVKDRTSMVRMTDGTTFLKRQPDSKEMRPASKSDLKVGSTIDAQGKLNSDGSLTTNIVIIVQTQST